jgi:hypothetical protein
MVDEATDVLCALVREVGMTGLLNANIRSALYDNTKVATKAKDSGNLENRCLCCGCWEFGKSWLLEHVNRGKKALHLAC